jgi:hypothetical protein
MIKLGYIITYSNGSEILVIKKSKWDLLWHQQTFDAVPIIGFKTIPSKVYDSWAVDYAEKQEIRKATPDEVLKAIVLTKNENYRYRLKRLLKYD